MKYLILISLLAFVGCDSNILLERKTETIDGMTVVTIDSCQYLQTKSTSYYGYVVTSFTHKGNCKNH